MYRAHAKDSLVFADTMPEGDRVENAFVAIYTEGPFDERHEKMVLCFLRDQIASARRLRCGKGAAWRR